MSSLPSATTRLQSQAGAAAVSTDLCAVFMPCAANDDGVPRQYTSTQDGIDEHGYCEGIEYLALHIDGTGSPALVVPVPIATPGALKHQHSVHTGTSKVTIAVGANGALAETDGSLKVVRGGTVGTDSILLSLSLDGETSWLAVRLGTATSYAVPRVGLTVSFGAGTLVDGDTILEWKSSAPMFNAAGVTLGVNGLKAQQRQVRSWLFVGDVSTLALGQAIQDAANSYETAERYVVAKFQARDRRTAESSKQRVAMTGGSAVTFAEVGSTGDTITRATGSFVTDGFQVGDYIRVTGSASNNISGKITGVTATVLTLDTADLTNEGPTAAGAVSITAEPSFTFATGPDTITRNRGSWITDGFAVGDVVTVGAIGEGTISVLTATVMTFSDLDLTAAVGTTGSCSAGAMVTFEESETDWLAATETLFEDIDGDPRVDIGRGRGRKLSPITGFSMRRPVQWADHIESYIRDLSRTTWEKAKGPLDGWSIDGEHDERMHETRAKFTTFRTWANGPNGAFICQSLTRATDGDVLGMTHNMYVASLMQTVVQRETENFVGRVIPLNADGTAKRAALADFEATVNRELARNLLVSVEGGAARASAATWRAATDDVLNVADATMTGVGTLNLNGTIVHVNTKVRVS